MVVLADGYGGPATDHHGQQINASSKREPDDRSSASAGASSSASSYNAAAWPPGPHDPFPPPPPPGGPDDSALSDADALLDTIPAPVSSKPASPARPTSARQAAAAGFVSPYPDDDDDSGGGMGSALTGEPSCLSGPAMLANLHMRLLDFLAWDRTRGLRCGREGKQEAYWRALWPSPVLSGQQASSGGGQASSNGEAQQGTLAFDEEFGGVPETTLPGLRDSRELVQATPHGFPELLRLVAMQREGVVQRAETRRVAAARGFMGAGAGAGGREGAGARVLQARVLDPLGEVMRILRHVLRSEEARPFVAPPSDADVAPDAGTGCALSGGGGDEMPGGVDGGAGEAGGGGDDKEGGGGDGKGGGGDEEEVKRPLDLGTILKRAESGWYDLEAASKVREREPLWTVIRVLCVMFMYPIYIGTM